jgi:hypothetical protein
MYSTTAAIRVITPQPISIEKKAHALRPSTVWKPTHAKNFSMP